MMMMMMIYDDWKKYIYILYIYINIYIYIYTYITLLLKVCFIYILLKGATTHDSIMLFTLLCGYPLFINLIKLTKTE